MGMFEGVDTNEYDGGSIGTAACIRKAKSKNMRIVTPEDNELQIDIDTEEQLARFSDTITNPKVAEILQVMAFEKKVSPSGRPGRYHVTVILAEAVDDRKRIFLQALLCSDPVRELLGWKRIEAGIPDPSIFFEANEPEAA